MSSAVADSLSHVVPGASTPPAAELELGTDRRTSIVYFVPQLTVGGTETQLAELVLCLDRTRFAPIVWSPGPWGPIGDRLKQHGVSVCRIRLSTRRPVSFVQSVRWLRGIKPKIFHSFGYADHWLDVLAARGAGIPICVTCRRNVRHWDPAHRLHWSERLRNRWANLVVANSCAVAATCAEVERIPRERIQVIYNGVELGGHRVMPGLRRALGLDAADLLVGNVANLKRVKGQDILLHAFREVVKEVPRAYLAICGEGEERASLERLCRKLGLNLHVFFLGLRRDMEQVYPSLDLYAHSSRAEGLPTSVLEAMAHGVAVVATSAGGTAELLAGHAGDCLVPAEEPSMLGKAMVRMLKDEFLRSQHGLAGQKTVASRFTLSRMVSEYESLYLGLLRDTAGLAAPVKRSATIPSDIRESHGSDGARS